MTAKEKFEARLQELGLLDEWKKGNDEHVGKVLEDGTIVVLTHYNYDEGGFYEDIFPSLEDLRQNETFRKECWSIFWCDGNKKFVADLACWLTGKEIDCPLFPVDVYLAACDLELSTTEFADDPVDLEIEETDYQTGIDENRGKLELISKQVNIFRAELAEMIREEFNRGHNLHSDFDPYPGWDSHHLCAYVIEGKTMVVEEMQDGMMVLALYQEGYDTTRLALTAPDFPVEVLFNIYNQMK